MTMIKIGKLYRNTYPRLWVTRGEESSGFTLDKGAILLLFKMDELLVEEDRHPGYENLSFLDGSGKKVILPACAAYEFLEEVTKEDVEECAGCQKKKDEK